MLATSSEDKHMNPVKPLIIGTAAAGLVASLAGVGAVLQAHDQQLVPVFEAGNIAPAHIAAAPGHIRQAITPGHIAF
jgi:hypothetical protein